VFNQNGGGEKQLSKPLNLEMERCPHYLKPQLVSCHISPFILKEKLVAFTFKK
jgi:hypothetical protein